jgi:hypothetical protein
MSALIKSENWDSVTAPAIPTGWNVVGVVTTTTGATPISSPNMIATPSSGSGIYTATWGTPDDNAGNCSVTGTGQFSSVISESGSNFAVFARANSSTVTYGTSTFYEFCVSGNDGAFEINVFNGAIESNLVDLPVFFVADVWYKISAYLNGSSLSCTVQRLSDNFWLNMASGSFESDTSDTIVTVTDTEIIGAGYAGWSGIPGPSGPTFGDDWSFSNGPTPGEAALTCVSTISAHGLTSLVAVAGAANLICRAVLHAQVGAIHLATANLTCQSIVLAKVALTHKSQANLICQSVLHATGFVAHSSRVSINCQSTLFPNGIVTHKGQANLTCLSILFSKEIVTHLGRASLTCQSTLMGTGVVTHLGKVSLACSSILFATAIVKHTAQANLLCQSALLAKGIVTYSGQVNLVCRSTFVAKGVVTHSGRANLTCISSFVDAGVTAHLGRANLTCSSNLFGTGAGAVTHLGRANLTCLSVLVSTGVTAHLGRANLTCTTSLVGTGVVMRTGRVNLTCQSILFAKCVVTHSSRSSLVCQSSLHAKGVVQYSGRANITCQSLIFAFAGRVLLGGNANLTCGSRFFASGVVAYLANANLVCKAFISCIAVTTHNSRATLICGSVLATLATVVYNAIALLSDACILMATVTKSQVAKAVLICDSVLTGVGRSQITVVIVSGSATLICSSSFGQVLTIYYEVGQGGVFVNGSAVVMVVYATIQPHGGVETGSAAIVAIDDVDDCTKPPLPLNPKPSIANYTPQNIAPLFEFFQPIVSGIANQDLTYCEMTFRYENNTPCIPGDDIFVRYPTCIPVPYTPVPVPATKSPELLLYESYAKKSQALYNFMINSPAHITYFQDLTL